MRWRGFRGGHVAGAAVVAVALGCGAWAPGPAAAAAGAVDAVGAGADCTGAAELVWAGGQPATVVGLSRVPLPSGPPAALDLGGLRPGSFVMSPGGDRVAFIAADDLGGSGTDVVWLVPTDGTAPPHRLGSSAAVPGLAWSPDGTRVAFRAADGALVVASADGTGETALDVGGLGVAGAASFSRDGTRLAVWASDPVSGERGVAVGPTDGSAPLHLLPTRSTAPADVPPQWSAGDARLVYPDTSNRVVLALPDGSAPATPLPSALTASRDLAVSPDGDWVAFAAWLPPDYINHVYIAPTDGSTPAVAVQDLAGPGGGEPAWSPDGTHLAFLRGGDVVTAPAMPAATITVLGPGDGTRPPTWAADGSQVLWGRTTIGDTVLVAAPADGSAAAADLVSGARGHQVWPRGLADVAGPGAGTAVVLVAAATGGAPGRVLATSPEGGPVVPVDGGVTTANAGLAVAPGRDRIAWFGTDPGTGDHVVLSAAPDGSSRVELDRVGNAVLRDAVFSPDGRALAWVVTNPSNLAAQVVVAPADGSAAPVVVSSATDTVGDGPVWSPDGTRLAYAGHVPGEASTARQVVVVGRDGTGATVLSSGTVAADHPSWSPDGTVVAWAADPMTLWRAPADGSAAGVQIGSLPGNPYYGFAGRPVWSPDGGRLAWAAPNNWVTSTVASSHASQLLLVDPDGTDAVQFEGEAPAWSPDGQLLAYAVDSYTKFFGSITASGAVGLVGRDGGSPTTPTVPTQVPAGASVDPPVWAPDGRSLWWTYRGAAANALVVDRWDRVSGTATAWVRGASTPTFSPDGRRLVVVAAWGNVWSVTDTVTPGGTHAVQRLAETTGATGLAWVSSSDAPLCAARPGGAFHAMAPARVLDSRVGTGFAGPVGPGEARPLTVAGVGDVPAGASAVVLALTATEGTAPSYLQLYPDGAPPPVTANLLFAPGQTVTNLVTVAVGPGGQVDVFNQQGSVHAVADVVGWYDDGSVPAPAGGAWFHPLAPTRVLDSRTEVGGWSSVPLGGEQTRTVAVAGVAGIPAGATAVVANVTVTGADAASYVRAAPAGATPGDTATVVFAPNQTVSAAAVLPVGDGGAVALYNQQGTVDVVVDVVGWFDPSPGGMRFHAVTPVRLLDSRQAGPWSGVPLAVGEARPLTVAGPVLPPTAVAVVANLTVTGGTAASFLSASPSPSAVPAATASVLFAAGETIPNQVTVGAGPGGAIDLFNQLGTVHVVVDAAGYYAWR